MHALANLVAHIREHQVKWMVVWLSILGALDVILLQLPSNKTIMDSPFMMASFVLWALMVLMFPWVVLWAPDYLFPKGWDSR